MSGRRCALLVALWLLSGCAEGGVTGTGISSVSGNVVQIAQTGDAGSAALPFAVRVTVQEQPSATAVTDADGAFTVRGRFSGAITLQFSNAGDGALLGPLPLEVPAGSSTVLENIQIELGAPLGERVHPRAVRQLDVFGRLDLAECASDGTGTILVTDDAKPPRQFMASLTADTVLRDADGAALTCTALTQVRRPRVRVEGFLRLSDQTIVATLVMVVRQRPEPPAAGTPRPEHIQGVVTAVDCAQGRLEVAQALAPEPVGRVVQIEADTEVRCAGPPPSTCSCADLAVGELVAVLGEITPAKPGVVTARRITIGSDAI